jgi:hypothetical protein
MNKNPLAKLSDEKLAAFSDNLQRLLAHQAKAMELSYTMLAQVVRRQMDVHVEKATNEGKQHLATRWNDLKADFEDFRRYNKTTNPMGFFRTLERVSKFKVKYAHLDLSEFAAPQSLAEDTQAQQAKEPTSTTLNMLTSTTNSSTTSKAPRP